jgi:hypothetical protein
MLGAFAALWRSGRSASRLGNSIMAVALVGGCLQALSEFGEAWAPHGFAWGLVAAAGLFLTCVALIWLGIRPLRGQGVQMKTVVPLVLGAMIPVQMIAVMLPYQLWRDERLSALAGLVVTMVYGAGWIFLGVLLCTQGDPSSAHSDGQTAASRHAESR